MPDNAVLNFGHPLSERSHKRLGELIGSYLYVHQRLHVRFNDNLVPQVIRCVNDAEAELRAKGTSLETVGRLYMVGPGLTDPAILLALELLGRTGNFPCVVLQRRDMTDGGFHVYGVVDGLKLRNDAHGRRGKSWKPTE